MPSDSGMLKLLGALSIVLAPLTMAMSFAEGYGDLFVISKSFSFYASGPIVPWIVRLISVLLVPIGIAMIKGANQLQKTGGRIAITPHGIVFAGGPKAAAGREIKYKDISKISTSEKKGRGFLTFWEPNGKIMISSSEMKSRQDFDEMCATLKERVQGSLVSSASGC